MQSTLFTSIRTLLVDHAIQSLFDRISINFFTSFRGSGEKLSISEIIKIKKFQFMTFYPDGLHEIIQGVTATVMTIDEVVNSLNIIYKGGKGITKHSLLYHYKGITSETKFLVFEGRSINNNTRFNYFPMAIRDINSIPDISFYR